MASTSAPTGPDSMRFRTSRTVGEPLFNRVELSDVVVVVTFMSADGIRDESREYALHSLLLKSNSSWFLEALTPNPHAPSPPSRRLELVFDDTPEYQEAVELVFRYFYSHEIDISATNYQGILQVAHLLGVATVVDHCVDFLVPRLRPDNCLSALRSALDLGPHPGFTDAVLAYTASHLTDLIALAVGKGDDLHRPSTSYPATNTEPVTSRTNPVVVALAVLEPIHIQRVLTDPALKVPTETVVVNFVRLYLHARNTGGQALEPVSDADVRMLYGCVRLHWVNSTTLSELSDDPVAPLPAIRAAMVLRLRLVDAPELVRELPPTENLRACYTVPEGKFMLPDDQTPFIFWD